MADCSLWTKKWITMISILKEESIQRITELEAKLATTALDEKNYNEMVDKRDKQPRSNQNTIYRR